MAIYINNQDTYNFVIGQLDFILHVLFFGRNADWVISFDPREWDRPTRKELERERSKAIEMYDQCVKFIANIKQTSSLDRKNLKKVYNYINDLNYIIDFLNDRIEEEKNKKEEENEEIVIIEDDDDDDED